MTDLLHRLGAYRREAWKDTIGTTGHDLVTNFAVGLAAAVLVGVTLGRWDAAAFVAIGGVLLYVVAAYMLYLVLNAVGVNRRWRPVVEQAGTQVVFNLKARGEDQWIHGHAVEITDPAGHTYRAESTLPQRLSGLWFGYPQHFPGAADPYPLGRYKAVWFAGASNGRWREILRHQHTVTTRLPG